MLGWLRHVHNRTRQTFVPTPELCDELASLGFRDLKVLSRGVDTRLFRPALRSPALRSSWGAAPEDPVALHAGRMAAEKNYPLLFRAYAALRTPLTHAVVSCSSATALRASLQGAHPECVFTGFITRDELARHYASADVYLHASPDGNVW